VKKIKKKEKEFLSYLHHSFIINMKYSFQDFENLYLVMDLLKGRDLHYHINKKNLQKLKPNFLYHV